MSIEIGDEVQIRFPVEFLGGTNDLYTVINVPSNSPSDASYWELSRDNDLYIFDCPIVLKKINGAQ